MPIDLRRLCEEKLPTEAVPVPEWKDLIAPESLVDGDKLLVGCLTSAERGLFEHATPDKAEDSAKSVYGRYVAWCLREPDGRRMYEEPELAAQHLSPRNNAVIRRLFKACKRVNGEGDEAMADAEKNSESGQNSSSGTT